MRLLVNILQFHQLLSVFLYYEEVLFRHSLPSHSELRLLATKFVMRLRLWQISTASYLSAHDERLMTMVDFGLIHFHINFIINFYFQKWAKTKIVS